jgi:hypothetical protein
MTFWARPKDPFLVKFLFLPKVKKKTWTLLFIYSHPWAEFMLLLLKYLEKYFHKTLPSIEYDFL